MTTRRALLIAFGAGVLACTSTARAQAPAKVRRIGFLSPYSHADAVLSGHQAFRLGLRDLGWVEGRNISIEYRYAEGRNERLPELATELVRLKVDVIVANETPDTRASKNATKAIPIVMAAPVDPVGGGLVESLARPGGNVTGLSQMGSELMGKRLELLKEMVPRLSRVAVLRPPNVRYWKDLQLPARHLGIQLHSMEVRGPDDFDQAFDDAIKARAGALFVIGSQAFFTNMKRIVDFAAQNRMPSMFPLSAFVDAGGLVAYGADRADMFRRAATYVDKILKGAKPGDLPVELPTKFELVINVKTAKALGLNITQDLRLRADRVIE